MVKSSRATRGSAAMEPAKVQRCPNWMCGFGVGPEDMINLYFGTQHLNFDENNTL
jgi:hypothetical protein